MCIHWTSLVFLSRNIRMDWRYMAKTVRMKCCSYTLFGGTMKDILIFSLFLCVFFYTWFTHGEGEVGALGLILIIMGYVYASFYKKQEGQDKKNQKNSLAALFSLVGTISAETLAILVLIFLVGYILLKLVSPPLALFMFFAFVILLVCLMLYLTHTKSRRKGNPQQEINPS